MCNALKVMDEEQQLIKISCFTWSAHHALLHHCSEQPKISRQLPLFTEKATPLF